MAKKPTKKVAAKAAKVVAVEEEVVAPPATVETVVVSAPEPEEPKAPKKAPLSAEEKMAVAIGKALADALPVALGAILKVQADAAAKSKLDDAALLASYRPTGERCRDCLQLLPAGVEQGKHLHKRVCVFPKNRRNGKWFQGVRINGQLYLSNGPGHNIIVPADAPVEYILERWEENEEIQKEGREAEHNSGGIGGASVSVPAQQAWR